MTLLKRSHWTEMGHMRMNSMQKMGVKGAEGREEVGDTRLLNFRAVILYTPATWLNIIIS